MVKQISNIKELSEALGRSTGYFVGVTLFDGRGLNHFFLSENFPQNDLLRSLAKVKQLVVEDLEKPFVASESKPDITPEDIIDATPSDNS